MNNLQKLWNYCETCTICNIKTTLWIYNFNNYLIIDKTEKTNIHLIVTCRNLEYKSKYPYSFQIIINCLKNSFQVKNLEDQSEVSLQLDMEIASQCQQCYRRTTSDIIRLNNNVVTNSVLWTESINLTMGIDEFHFTINHTRGYTQVAKNLVHCGILPTVEFDFLNKEKLIDRIKSLLVFS